MTELLDAWRAFETEMSVREQRLIAEIASAWADLSAQLRYADILTGKAFNANSGVPDCQVVTELFLPIDTDPEIAIRIGYEAALTSPFCYLVKPVVLLVSDGFDKMPYLKLRVKAYVFDHRYEPRMMSDITARVKAELRRQNLLAPWRELTLSKQAGSTLGEGRAS